MITVREDLRIVQLDQYNMTFEVYKSTYNSVKKEYSEPKWTRTGGYYSNLKMCLKAIKDYIIAEENEKNDNLDIFKLLDEINNAYINCELNIKKEN